MTLVISGDSSLSWIRIRMLSFWVSFGKPAGFSESLFIMDLGLPPRSPLMRQIAERFATKFQTLSSLF